MKSTILLVVEDDVLMSRMYHKIFEKEGYEVIMAKDGEEALELTRQRKPTLILLDIMMPKMNGFQVLERLKSDPEVKDLPVVMLTNLAGERDAQAALSKGAIRYIIKSEHDPKEVSDIVKEIIAGYTRDSVPQAAGS